MAITTLRARFRARRQGVTPDPEVNVVFLLSTLALATPTLTVTGDCPGVVDIDIVGLTHGTTVAILAGSDFGEDPLRTGRCEGTVTALTGPTLITTARDLDPDGRLLLRPLITDPAVCTRIIQALDGADCAASGGHRLGAAPGGTFRGYADWAQDVSLQSDAEQDAAMDAACAAAWPESEAATVEQIASGGIEDLPPTNDSGRWLVAKCPECAGTPDGSAVDGHCRNCVDPDLPFPVALPPDGWHDNCCNNTRSAACID